MRGTTILWVLFITAAAAGPLHAQSVAPSIKAQLIARMQFQFTTTSVDEQQLIAAGRSTSGVAASNFEVRRMRLGADLEFDKWLSGSVEAELAMSHLQMRNVYMNMNFRPELQLRVGQFKKPFSQLELITESVWPVIERGVRIRGLNDMLLAQDSAAGGTRVLATFKGNVLPGEEQSLLDVLRYNSYDLGASLHGTMRAFSYDAGVFNGTGSDSNDENAGKTYAARLAYKLPSEMPATIGAAFARREARLATKPTITDVAGNGVEADLEIGAFRRPGFHFLGEVARGSTLVVDDHFWGVQGMVAAFVPIKDSRVEGLEVAGRASYADPRKDVADDDGLLLTPGVNVYFSGRNRLMLNYDVYSALGDRLSGAHALRFQAQLYY